MTEERVTVGVVTIVLAVVVTITVGTYLACGSLGENLWHKASLPNVLDHCTASAEILFLCVTAVLIAFVFAIVIMIVFGFLAYALDAFGGRIEKGGRVFL